MLNTKKEDVLIVKRRRSYLIKITIVLVVMVGGLFNTHSQEQRQTLNNSGYSKEVKEAYLESKHKDIKLSKIKKLANHTHTLVRRGLATNQKIPEDILLKLANDKEKMVRWQVAVRDNCPISVLKHLVTDESDIVRQGIATNTTTPAEVLSLLEEDASRDVLLGLTNNENTSISSLKVIAQSKDGQVRGFANNALEKRMQLGKKAKISLNSRRAVLGNDKVQITWQIEEGVPILKQIKNRLDNSVTSLLPTPLFEIEIDSTKILASDFTVKNTLKQGDIITNSADYNKTGQNKGKQVTLTLVSTTHNVEVKWTALLYDDSHYVRQLYTITPLGHEIFIRYFSPMTLKSKGIKRTGVEEVRGLPVLAKNVFFGYELPQSQIKEINQGISFIAQINSNYSVGKSLKQSTVIGCASPNQVRRSFLKYLEQERAHPYHQFFHYQSWDDLHTPSYAGNSDEFVNAIKGWNELFVKPYNIQFDCFVLDDGWDDVTDCWAINKELFPQGLDPLSNEAAKTNSNIGLWFSPAGGYLMRAQERYKHGIPKGYTYHLSDETYYNRFKEMTSKYMRENRVNYFKFDRLGNWADAEAAFKLSDEIRKIDPKVFINLTVGSWPSPFFLKNIDCIWRDNDDMGYIGKGTKTQQWINFRDGKVFENICKKSSLYPLNSIMSHGIVYSLRFRGAFINEGLNDFKDQVRSFFGSGANLQELYISHDRMLPEYWEVLAEAVKWSKANEDVLVDTHWIGGDPSLEQIYGWASWNKRKGLITLRNPSDKEQVFTMDIGKIFELPKGAVQQYELKSPWQEDIEKNSILAMAGETFSFTLKPFEILNYDAWPKE